jgi:hypothetical protein
MVSRKVFVVLVAIFFLTTSALAAEVEGVKFPDKMKANGQDLTFNGGGKRTKFGLQVYVAGLYLKQKSGEAARIVDGDETMEIRLQITSSLVSANKMKSVVMEGFENLQMATWPHSKPGSTPLWVYLRDLTKMMSMRSHMSLAGEQR